MKNLISFCVAILLMAVTVLPLLAQVVPSLDVVQPITDSFLQYICWPYIALTWAFGYIALKVLPEDSSFPKIWVVIAAGAGVGLFMFLLGFCSDIKAIFYTFPFSVVVHKAITSPLKNYFGIEL